MKLKTELIALCDYSSISQDGKLSINGVFDFIYVNEFPGGLARFFLVVTFKSDPNSTHNISIVIEPDPLPKNPFKNSGQMKVGPNGKGNLMFEINGLVFQKAGEYQLQIKSEGVVVGAVLLNVIHKKTNEQKTVN